MRIVYDVGLLMKKDAMFYGASPESMVLIDWMSLAGATDWTPSLVVQSSFETVALVPVDVKSLISKDRLSSVLRG